MIFGANQFGRDSQIFSDRTDGMSASIFILKNSQPLVRVEKDQSIEEFLFCKIQMEIGHSYIIQFSYDDTHPELHVNGMEIPRAESTFAISIPFSRPYFVDKYTAYLDELPPINNLPMNERRFLQILSALENNLLQGGENSAIECASRLRTILIQSNSLLHPLCKKYDVKSSFPVNITKSEPPIDQKRKFHLTMVYLRGTRMRPRCYIGLEDFLSFRIGSIGSTTITIADLIKFSANTLGPAHFGLTAKSTTQEKLLLESYSREKSMNEPILLDSMKDIARASLDGLKPLVDAIVSENIT